MQADEYYAWEAEQIEKYGWYAHFVFDAHNATGHDIHTHGLPAKYGHPDLQIVIPLPEDVALGIFWAVVHKIEDGAMFFPGMRASEIVKGYDVKFVMAKECDRDVLRIILPDKEGGLDRGCFKQENFNFQYEGVTEDAADKP